MSCSCCCNAIHKLAELITSTKDKHWLNQGRRALAWLPESQHQAFISWLAEDPERGGRLWEYELEPLTSLHRFVDERCR